MKDDQRKHGHTRKTEHRITARKEKDGDNIYS
jgi:hypothetical protein